MNIIFYHIYIDMVILTLILIHFISSPIQNIYIHLI